MIYRDVCIRNTKNPLVFTPLYTTFGGDQLPIYRDITLENVHILTPGSYTFLGLDAEHKLGLKLDNVFADDQAALRHGWSRMRRSSLEASAATWSPPATM